MFTYAILLICAVYLLVKWVNFLRFKHALLTPGQMDEELIAALNNKGDTHAE